MAGQVSDHELERYYLRMVKVETELGTLEEHLLACGSCADRAAEDQDYEFSPFFPPA